MIYSNANTKRKKGPPHGPRRGINPRKPFEGENIPQNLKEFVENPDIIEVEEEGNLRGKPTLNDIFCIWCASKPCLCEKEAEKEDNRIKEDPKVENKANCNSSFSSNCDKHLNDKFPVDDESSCALCVLPSLSAVHEYLSLQSSSSPLSPIQSWEEVPHMEIKNHSCT